MTNSLFNQVSVRRFNKQIQAMQDAVDAMVESLQDRDEEAFSEAVRLAEETALTMAHRVGLYDGYGDISFPPEGAA